MNEQIKRGDTDDLSAWEVETAAGIANVTSLGITDDEVNIAFFPFLQPIRVAFEGPPPIWQGVSRGILESFDLAVPFP